MKVQLLHERDEQFEVVNGTGWEAGIVAAANVQYEATVVAYSNSLPR